MKEMIHTLVIFIQRSPGDHEIYETTDYTDYTDFFMKRETVPGKKKDKRLYFSAYFIILYY